MIMPVIASTNAKSGIDKKLYKRCIKCREWKLKTECFGTHNSSDGRQSICYSCKNERNKAAQKKNTTARLRHHIATRCLDQLGSAAPETFTKDLEFHLGYRIAVLVKHLRADLQTREGPKRKLRDALNEGYHIDHIRPLSLYRVVRNKPFSKLPTVDWDEFKRCWAITNLSAIPGAENLAKGATYQAPAAVADVDTDEVDTDDGESSPESEAT